MICNRCNKLLPDDSIFCQFCGNTVSNKKNNNRSLKTWLIISVTTVFILSIVIIAILFNGDTQNIFFSKSGIYLNVGETTELESFISPAHARDKSCSYISSDESIAIINDNTVLGVDEGTAIITIMQSDISYGQCTVTVKHIEPTAMYLEQEEDTIVGQIAREIEVPITYEPSSVTDYRVFIEIDNPEIAEVKDGKIIGLSEGETAVKVWHRATDLTVSFNLKVEPVELESFTIDIPQSIKIGDEISLNTVLTPTDATDSEFKWSSSSSCAVIEDGVLIGKKEGTATITAKHSSGLKETVEIVVYAVPIEKISLKSETGNNTFQAAKSIQLVPSFTPANATVTKLTWSSDNNSVAKVDSNGKVVGVSAGTANISVTTPDGKNASFKVVVKPIPLEIRNSWVVKPSAYCCCPMEIHAPKNESVYVYFKEDRDSTRDFGVLVKAGSTYSFDAPTGTYTLYYASGTTWYGKDLRFGEDTSYEKSDTKLTNSIVGNYAYGHTLTLYGVYNGNMDSDYIPESQFPG